MDDAAVARAHRVERDDLALGGDTLAQPARHLGELVFVACAVPLGVDRDVPATFAGTVRDARRQVLDGLEHGASLADDAASVGPLDLEPYLVLRAFAVVGSEDHVGVHLHRLDELAHELERPAGLRVGRAFARGTLCRLALRDGSVGQRRGLGLE